MKLDRDIKEMSFEERGKALQRFRNLLRIHKKKKGNHRCWLNDKILYDQALPEGSEQMGLMDLPEEILLRNCRKYIRGQQCKTHCQIQSRRKSGTD